MLSRICFWKVAGILELLSISLLATCFGRLSTGDAHCCMQHSVGILKSAPIMFDFHHRPSQRKISIASIKSL